jgi:2,5-diketo-D-gluconate reductase A
MLSNGIQPEAYSPLAAARSGIFENPTLSQIAERHGKSVSQVVLRWLIQRGVVVIPKSVHKDRIAQNIDVFDFELTDTNLAAIAGLDTGTSLYFDATDPEVVKQFRDFAR